MQIPENKLLGIIERARSYDLASANKGEACFIVIDASEDGSFEASGVNVEKLHAMVLATPGLDATTLQTLERYKKHKLEDPMNRFSAIVFHPDGEMQFIRGRYAEMIMFE